MRRERSVLELPAAAPVQSESVAESSRVDPFATYQAQSVFGSLDALRAVSIVAVVWHHSLTIPEWVQRALPGAEFGFLGVDLFFVLSGFLIVTLLSRERARAGDISLRKFYARRALRIFPLYYGVVGLLALLYALRPQGSGAAEFWQSCPYLLLYLTNWVPSYGILQVSWSLAAEEQFYLIWPPIERFLQAATLPILGALIALSQLIHFGALDVVIARLGMGPDELRMLREITFTPILLGVLLAHLLHRRTSFMRMYPWLGQRLAAPLLALSLFFLLQFYPQDLRGLPRLTVHLMMFLLVAAVVMREDHGLSSVCRQAWLVRLGALSYGIYLLHNLALGVVNKVLEEAGLELPFADFVLGGLLVYGMATLSHRYYEAPFLRLKRRFA